MRKLVVSPHPDDAEIGLGASIHRWVREGHLVTIGVCTGEGDLTMVHSAATIPFSQRREEQRQAALELGAAVIWYELAPASRFDSLPQSMFVSAFDRSFCQFDEVYLPLPSYNDDHKRVFAAGLAAFRPGKLDGVPLLAYEQACSQCLGEPGPFPYGRRYIPVTGADMRAKRAAIDCHQSQMHGRGESIYGTAGADINAKMRGMEGGASWAELVYLLRERV
jgi:N-acetylglucosamine malate deacetylase 1